ncbi:MAG: hypothetical protein AAGJ82_01635 [Bacteroidota bacterium]
MAKPKITGKASLILYERLRWLLLLLLLGSVRVQAQQDLSRLDYDDHGLFHQLAYESIFPEELLFPDTLVAQLNSTDRMRPQAVRYTLLLLNALRVDNGQAARWSDSILQVQTAITCAQETTQRAALSCAAFVKEAKRWVLKRRMNAALLNKAPPESYCDTYWSYSVLVPKEASSFRANYIQPGYGGDPDVLVFDWTSALPYHTERFVAYDCAEALGLWQLEGIERLVTRGIFNGLENMIQDERVYELLEVRLREYVVSHPDCDFKIAVDQAIQKFYTEAAAARKGQWYDYRASACGIPLRFTTWESSWNPDVHPFPARYVRRGNKGKLIRSKRSIVREFRRSPFYKILIGRS